MKDEKKAERGPGEPASAAKIASHSSFHRIRLGPPWHVTTTENGARHARKFGHPRTLDASERLWLVCEHLPGPAEVLVNGAPLDPPDALGPFAADITPLLQPRNEVVFSVASTEPLGPVALEVRPG